MSAIGSRPARHPIRVLVVDDSAAQRAMLIALLESDPELEVVGWATDGAEAVRATARLRPNVVAMDLRMPGMGGLEAARRIMSETPAPIVLVTETVTSREQQVTADMVSAGVLAVVAKPRPGLDSGRSSRALLRTIKTMAAVKIVRRMGATSRIQPRSNARRPRLVAIAASTGGPQALHRILPALPANFGVPIMVVQHIASGFEGGLIDWLGPLCAVPIGLAVAGQRLTAPGIYVAPSGCHLGVRGGVVTLTDEAPIAGHRPSATMLFQSVACEYGPDAVGVLLTGMGDDGAAGLRDLKHNGGLVVAQDEASSTVFGMPAAAIELGIVDHVLPPERIASLLTGLVAPIERQP